MNGLELKKILYDNPDYIVAVLERLGCDRIKITSDSITSTRPSGDNPTSVHVRLSELLPSKCFTKNEFEAKFEKRDFIELVQFFADLKMIEAMKYICETCGISTNIKIEKKQVSSTLSFLKHYKKATGTGIDNNDIILNESELDDFLYYPSYRFYQDNIDIKTQIDFGVCYDIMQNRVVFPIRNKNGKLVNKKGRTLYEDYRSNNIPKYLYYHDFSGNSNLFGEYENLEFLKSCDEIYVVESEKGVMQAVSFGVRNCVATSKKVVSKQQLHKLLSYGKTIVIAYDKGVDINDIKLECDKFKGLVDVYYIYDTLGILESKESPTDKGIDVFQQLTDKCKFKYER